MQGQSARNSSSSASIADRTVGNLVISSMGQDSPVPGAEAATRPDDSPEARPHDSPVEFRPVVVVLGWLGGQDRHVKKYSDMYCKMGGGRVTTVRSLCSIEQGVWKMHERNAAMAQELLDTLESDAELAGRPVILAPFSNGGCQVIEFLLRAAYSGDKKAQSFVQNRLAGYVYDSCPVKVSTHSISTAMSISFKKHGAIAEALAYFAFYAFFGLWILGALLGFSELRDAVLHAVLSNDPSRVPTLFVYSQNDEITDCRHLEEFIARRAQECGVAVEDADAAKDASDEQAPSSAGSASARTSSRGRPSRGRSPAAKAARDEDSGRTSPGQTNAAARSGALGQGEHPKAGAGSIAGSAVASQDDSDEFEYMGEGLGDSEPQAPPQARGGAASKRDQIPASRAACAGPATISGVAVRADFSALPRGSQGDFPVGAITKWKLPSSPHVSHLMTSPTEYEERAAKHLLECAAWWRQRTAAVEEA